MNDSMMCQTVSLVHVLHTYAIKGLVSVRRSLTLLPILKLEGGYTRDVHGRAGLPTGSGRAGPGCTGPKHDSFVIDQAAN